MLLALLCSALSCPARCVSMVDTFRVCAVALPHIMGSHPTILQLACDARCAGAACCLPCLQCLAVYLQQGASLSLLAH